MNRTIPLVVGVTGHRDLRPEDIGRLEERVRKIFEDFQGTHPNTPVLVLSSLAEGADRLVTRVALKCGARLIVPLPLARSEYERDFPTPESKDEFESLLSSADRWFELPFVVGNTPEGVQRPGPERDRQYAQAGAYIARHCQILIALWDGVESELPGGTAQVVKFKRHGVPEPYSPTHESLYVPDTGPVYHIITPRSKNPHPSGEPFSLQLDLAEAKGGTIRRSTAPWSILERVDTFNRDAQSLSPKLAEEITRSRAFVIPDAALAGLSELSRFILERYALADTLAIHFQRLRRWTMIGLFGIAMSAVLSFEVYAHLLSKWWVLALYPLSLGSAFLLYRWARGRDCQNKHLEYRALAEGLRVQLFWQIAGLTDEVADHYLRKQRTELEWIRTAIRAWNLEAGLIGARSAFGESSRLPQDCLRSLRAVVLPHWVEDQRAFFTKAAARDREKIGRHDSLVSWFFGVGLALATAIAALDFRLGETSTHSFWHHFLVVLTGTAPAIAAAMGGYAEKMAFSAQAKRYEWMCVLYMQASKTLQLLLSQAKVVEAQQVIRELGKEALEENGDWVMTHRERPLEVPKG